MRNLLLTMTLGFVTACATVGTNVTAEQATVIQPGMTKAEVVELLGKPNHAFSMNGQTHLMWIQATSKATAATFVPYVGAFAGGANTETNQFTVVIEDGVVVDTNRQETASQLRYGLGAGADARPASQPSDKDDSDD